MVKKRGISKTEIAITLVCLLLIWASWYGLENVDEFLALRDLDLKRPVIGKITLAQNDARHRRVGSFVWFKAKGEQDIRGGDSIFTGDNSNIQVGLNGGSGVSLGENSLVVFNEFDNIVMPDLQLGNFSFKVNGTGQFMINGQLTTVQGDGAEIQFVIKKGENPVVKLLKGVAQVGTAEEKNKSLVLNKASSLKVKDESFTPPKNFILTDYKKDDRYIWSLYDIYNVQGLQLIEKETLPKAVKKPHAVAWTDGYSVNTIVEYGNDTGFREKVRTVSNTGTYTFNDLYLGANYWRVSIDLGKTWSKTEMFTVTGAFDEAARPRITRFSDQIPLITKKSTIQLDVKVPFDTIGYATEASRSPDFAPAETRRFWSPGRDIKLSFFKTGVYYYRFRSVSKEQKLSAWSDVQRFNVYVPSIPDAPDLLKLSRRDGSPGETFRINWDTKGTLTKTAVIDSNGVTVAEEIGTTVRFQPKRTGRYKVIARAYNQFGQASPTSKPFYLRVAPQPNHLLQAMKDAQKRKVAQAETAEGETSLKLEDLALLQKRNQSYKSSQFSVRGMVWTLQSSDQFYGGDSNSVAAGVALRGIKWFDRLGVEGLFKTAAVKLSNGGGTDMQSVDVRMHHRFFFALPVKFAPETQVSGFVGYGTSANSGDNFAQDYSLVKFGTSFEFPLGNNWMTGGELVYGLGGDSSTQSEIAGHLDYFKSKEWSIGVGYRLYLFEAGSTSTAPNGTLPYREGYTEGYSTINYHF